MWIVRLHLWVRQKKHKKHLFETSSSPSFPSSKCLVQDNPFEVLTELLAKWQWSEAPAAEQFESDQRQPRMGHVPHVLHVWNYVAMGDPSRLREMQDDLGLTGDRVNWHPRMLWLCMLCSMDFMRPFYLRQSEQQHRRSRAGHWHRPRQNAAEESESSLHNPKASESNGKSGEF